MGERVPGKSVIRKSECGSLRGLETVVWFIFHAYPVLRQHIE